MYRSTVKDLEHQRGIGDLSNVRNLSTREAMPSKKKTAKIKRTTGTVPGTPGTRYKYEHHIVYDL